MSAKKVKVSRTARPRTRSLDVASTATQGVFEHRELHLDDLKAILARARKEALGEDDASQIEAAVETLALLTAEIEAKGITIARLRRMLFGPSSEKSCVVLPKDDVEPPSDAGQELLGAPADGEASSPPGSGSSGAPSEAPPAKRPGHGRRAAEAYVGAERVEVPHPTLSHKGPCPVEGCEGKVYVQKKSRRGSNQGSSCTRVLGVIVAFNAVRVGPGLSPEHLSAGTLAGAVWNHAQVLSARARRVGAVLRAGELHPRDAARRRAAVCLRLGRQPRR